MQRQRLDELFEAMLDEFARRDLTGVLHDPCKRRTAITLRETAACKSLRQSSPTGLQQFSEAQGVGRRRALLIIVEVNENEVTGHVPDRPSAQACSGVRFAFASSCFTADRPKIGSVDGRLLPFACSECWAAVGMPLK
jgi:hypothetical protein